MNIYPKDFCIFVASHVSKEQRLDYLTICLKSLIYQELKIPIYLSISFENELLKEGFEKQHSEFDKLCSFLNVNYMKDKTSQMRHYYELLKKMAIIISGLCFAMMMIHMNQLERFYLPNI